MIDRDERCCREERSADCKVGPRCCQDVAVGEEPEWDRSRFFEEVLEDVEGDLLRSAERHAPACALELRRSRRSNPPQCSSCRSTECRHLAARGRGRPSSRVEEQHCEGQIATDSHAYPNQSIRRRRDWTESLVGRTAGLKTSSATATGAASGRLILREGQRVPSA